MFFIIFWEVSLQLQPYAKLSYQAVASHLPVGWHQASHRPLCQKGNKSHFKLWTHVWLNISDIKPNKDEVQKLYLNIWTVLIPRAGFKHSAVFGFCLLRANAGLYLSKPKWIRTCCLTLSHYTFWTTFVPAANHRRHLWSWNGAVITSWGFYKYAQSLFLLYITYRTQLNMIMRRNKTLFQDSHIDLRLFDSIFVVQDFTETHVEQYVLVW